MPNWDGIEDVSEKPLRVWLARVKETDNWKPLRKVDCMALNEPDAKTVVIEGGRYTADKETGIMRANFHRAPQQTIRSAVWFLRRDPNHKDKESNLDPILDEKDAQKMEDLYQKAIKAISLFGKGIDEVINDEIELEDGGKIKVVKSNGGTILSMKKYPRGWLTGKLDLQRGYGTYVVEGEDNETMLGPVNHIYFVVHGIGEAIWSREDVSMSSLIEDVTRVRINLHKRQVEGWKKQCEKNKKEGLPVPPMPNRVEFIPIEWYDSIHSSSNALTKSLKATTLPTVPAFRGIANEAVFDVLMYMTPTFCAQVLECVNSQITAHYNKYSEIHPSFLLNGGKCSLIGHSLGSVICWDLLSILKSAMASPGNSPTIERRESNRALGPGYADSSPNGVWGPTLPSPMRETLPFVPENAIFLGSPLGMFLTLRGAHPVFDELRREKADEILLEFHSPPEASPEVVESPNANGKEVEIPPPERPLPELPYASTFTLPVNGGVYNVFHPNDPVAYRIEPLLLPPDAAKIPPPVHLTVEGEGLRFHIKAQEIGGEIAKAMDNNKSWGQLIIAALGNKKADPPRALENGPKIGPKVFPLGGKSRRVDFQLQPSLVDPEYLSAVTAHSSYFVNTDIQDFVMGLAAKASAPAPTPTPTSPAS